MRTYSVNISPYLQITILSKFESSSHLYNAPHSNAASSESRAVLALAERSRMRSSSRDVLAMLACLVPLSLAHRSGPDTGRIPQPPQPPQPQHHQQAEAPDSDGPILSSLSTPQFDAPSVVYNWSAATFLHQPAKKGDVLVLLRDCVGVAAGRRLRLGTGTASEEEGVVATLQCPAPGLGPENPRDALGAAMGASASRAGTALLPAGASVERRGEQFVPASMELPTGRVEVPHSP